jgi:hypothetical protein
MRRESEYLDHLTEKFSVSVPLLDFDAVAVTQGTTLVPAERFPPWFCC